MTGRRRPAGSTPARWADVVTHPEYRGLWLAQALSLAGDQLARVALTVLVFDRTGSAAAAAGAYAVTMVPWLLGGPLLGGLGDRYPRRRVLIGADLGSAALVGAMSAPGLGLLLLCALLFAATLLAAPFSAARAALVRDLFGDDDLYARATAVTTVTSQVAQVAGFAVGGVAAAALGPRLALAADAGTFVASALLVRLTVRSRTAAAVCDRPSTLAGLRAGVGIVFGDRRLRSLTLLAWLAAFYVMPAGVVIPYARDRGGGPVAVGMLLAAVAAGTAVGLVAVGRLDTPRRLRLLHPLAIAAGIPLLGCALNPNLPLTALLWAASGAGTAYQLAANVAFVAAIPDAHRAQAFGLVVTGLAAGQGLGVVIAGAAAEAVAPGLVVAGAGACGTLLAAMLAAGSRHAPDAPADKDSVTGPGTPHG